METQGKLYIVPTPVGNLEDMTYRAVKVLKEADLILAEDTRTSSVLLKHYDIHGKLQSHHKFNEHQTASVIKDRILAGLNVALISDAGTPGISDPGFLLVRTCAAEGIEIQTLPGATACIPAVVSSGLPCDRFCFEGFLPVKKGRQTLLTTLATEPRTMVFYESPYRLVKTLEQFAGYFGPDREGRELFLEIGCGKGQFITSKAMDHPEADFIAIEGQETVILRALEKAKELDGDTGRLSNLRFVLTFVHSMDELFYENQLSGIYLNFSDPWPKARHEKRRLTYRDRLRDYAWALKPGGFVEVKTDNDVLYDFTLEEIEAAGYQITEQTRDLHSSSFESKNTTTEYEDKFSGCGKNINYVKFTV